MKKTFLTITGLLVVVAALFINAGETRDGLAVGDYAPDFTLKNTEGQMVSLVDYQDAKGFVVVFSCNTCPYVKLYEDRMVALDKAYATKGFPMIAINSNDINKQPGDSMDAMRQRKADKGFTFPYVRDDSQEIAKAYGATKTPHVYVLKKESAGKFKVVYIGAIDDNPREPSEVEETYVSDALDALLDNKMPKVTEKRAVGCTIKWKDS